MWCFGESQGALNRANEHWTDDADASSQEFDPQPFPRDRADRRD